MKTNHVIVLTALLIASTAQAAAKEILIRNATLLTVSRGTIVNGSLLIRDGKIAAIGTADQVKASSSAQIIDGTGKYVLPGIIDAHSHAGIEGNVNETTLANTGMVRVRDVLTGDDISSYRQLAGGTTAANILHGSANAIGGQNAVVKWKWGKPISQWVIADAPAGIKFALGENPKSSNFSPPAGILKPYPATRMGVEEVVRQAFTDARDYTARWTEYEAKKKKGEDAIPPRRDLLMDEMADIIRGKVFVHSHAYRADEILMLMNLADEMGFKIRTFQHVLEGYKVGREMAKHGAAGSTFIDWWGFKMEAYDAIPYNVALMTRDGVSVSVNSDSDELARHLNLDAAKAIKYGGLTEEEALRTCTLNPAIQLGIDHRVGSLEAGKDADLAIWNGHPLSTYSRVEQTMIEGEVYFDRAVDLRRREEFRREKEDLLKAEKEQEQKDKKDKKDKPAAKPDPAAKKPAVEVN